MENLCVGTQCVGFLILLIIDLCCISFYTVCLWCFIQIFSRTVCTVMLHDFSYCYLFNYFIWVGTVCHYYNEIHYYIFDPYSELLFTIIVQWILSSHHILFKINLKLIILSNIHLFKNYFSLTIKLRVLTRLVQKHMQAFSNCL